GAGGAKDVWEWAQPERKGALGLLNYHWLRAQALAALGDYALAEEELLPLTSAGRGQEVPGPREGMALGVGQAILDQCPGPGSLPHLLGRDLARVQFRGLVANLARDLRREADANALRGLLALQQGEVSD